MTDELRRRCEEIANQVVPDFRIDATPPATDDGAERRWNAAWEGAFVALGGELHEWRPAENEKG